MECVLLIGLQGAGKSTFYQTHFADTHAHVSMDLLTNARDKAAQLQREIGAALAAGRSLVVDNTNPTVLARAPIIQLARAHGARVVGYFLEASTRDAIARNSGREARARVPNVAIFTTAKKLEQPVLAEGFAQLFLVRAQPDRRFDVREWEGDLSLFRDHLLDVPVRVRGRERGRGAASYRYRVYVPPEYDASTETWPAILFLHGRGESGDDGARQTTAGLGPALVRHPERWPFVVLFPQKPERERQWEDYRVPVLAMLDRFCAEYRVDRTMMVLTGLSQGGHGTFEFGAAEPTRWAALASVCGYGDPSRYVPALVHVPVWAFHGEADDVVPIARSEAIVEALREAGGNVTFTRYPGVKHDAWEQAYADPRLPVWFLEQLVAARGRS